ncbi:hypothetical protein BH10ACI4_BH10ACI4_17790 [soil metagenome]
MKTTRIRRLATAGLLIATSASVFAAAPPSEPASSFSISEKTDVPGLTLKPGSYSIRVLDHLSDRMIIRIDSAGGEVHSTFIGLRDPQLLRSGTTGKIPWEKSPAGNTALRGYSFPGGTTVEFVYPKNEAVAIAKVNASNVPAIDPASEGKVADSTLSKDDMELVTLWMLSSTQVGPNDQPAIAAQKFKSTPDPASNSEQTSASAAGESKPRAARKPVVSTLPHTAGYTPAIWLAALLSLSGALVLRFSRVGSGPVKSV